MMSKLKWSVVSFTLGAYESMSVFMFFSKPSIRAIVTIFFGVIVPAKASGAEGDRPIWINLGFYSAHFDAQKGLRNANPGLGFEAPVNAQWSVTAGNFLNSDDQTSNYIGAYYRPVQIGHWRVGIVSGLFDGYPKAFNGGWFPAVLPTASWEASRWGLNIAVVPSIKNRLYGAVSFQFKYRLQ